MRRLLALALVAAPLIARAQATTPSAPASAPVTTASSTRDVVLPEGTEFTVVTSDDLSSKTAATGDVIRLTTGAPVAVDNVVVVPKGAYVRGSVGDVKRAGHFGRGGSMSLVVSSVTAIDGQHIPLRASRAKAGKDHVGATVALTVLFGPLGLLKHGNDAVYKAGTEIKCYTDSTITVRVPVGSVAAK